MAEVDDFSIRQSKRRRVDTGLPRNSYGQAQALSRAVNGNGVSEANQVLRRLLKPSNSQEGVNGDGDRLNSDDYVSASILSKSRHGGDGEESPNENSNSYLSSEEGQPRDSSMDLANKENGEDAPRPQEDDDDDDDYTDRSIVNGASKSENKCNENQSGNSEKPEEESLLAKRARVENIVTSMRQSPSQLNSDSKNNQGNETRRQKRKQVAPQPQRMVIQEEKKEGRKEEKRQLKQLLTQLQDHLNKLQHKYFELYDNEETDSEMEEGLENEVVKFGKGGQKGSSKSGSSQKDSHAQHSSANKKKRNGEDKVQSNAEDAIINGRESGRFSDALKDQLASAVTDVVDSVVRKFVHEQHSGSQPPTQDEACNLTVAHENHGQTYAGNKGSRSSPHMPYSKSSSMTHQDSPYQCEQMEAISLVVPHKNRDRPSRESTPRVESQSHHDYEPPVPATLPTSVAIPNPSLQYSFLPHMAVPISEASGSIDMSSYANGPLMHSQAAAILSAHSDPRHPMHQGLSHRDMTHPQPEGLPLSLLKAEPMMGESSPVSHDYSSLDSSGYSAQNNSCLSTTLTPAHLKKAKLMFFFARYPSSTVLKQHFPDVKFNRHNTAQLIKWFSNFREFYYIQMEKFARQSISEGLKNPEMLQVTRDSELFKVLNLHYNKSNEFEVPEPFLIVARKTLIEFFNAIKAGKDTDASWKKAIYKVISKLDDSLPEFFRSPDCLEELERLER